MAILALAGCLTGALLGGASPAQVALVEAFDVVEFGEPAAVHWPGYFWLWNGALEEEVLKAQLRDMREAGARSVCMLPMPKGFRPEGTNNAMEPDYLTPAFFERVRVAVDEASALGMHWWLYDEGGWPSGQALGKVREGRPEWGQQRLVRERLEGPGPYEVPGDAVALVQETPEVVVAMPGETWEASAEGAVAYVYRASVGGYVDLLNPAVTDRFIALTHEGYRKAIGGHFGKTVLFSFTDEPNAPNLNPPDSIPWTPGMDRLFRAEFGEELFESLPLLFAKPGEAESKLLGEARVEYYDLWTSRFREAYFERIRDWCHGQGLGSGGHLNGEDETVNAVRYGFGHALRQLRAMDVPGVDLIWRQLFPGRPDQHHFPKYASTAAHQNGTRYALTESFCVYGNGLTPAQMKWLVDYQYVRGLNLLVAGCYPLSTEEHHMTGERPHFGPCNPLWEHLGDYHAYVARVGYALSVGKPCVSTALYYPVRDLWAQGEDAKEAIASHDLLATELLAHQCDFDLIDDDMLAASSTHVAGDNLVAGAMRYDTVVCGQVRWMAPASLDKLVAFAKAGGRVICLDRAPATDGSWAARLPEGFKVSDLKMLGSRLRPTVRIRPANRGVRVAARKVSNGEILFFFNEGEDHFAGEALVGAGHAYELDAVTGKLTRLSARRGGVPVRLRPGESALVWLTDGLMSASEAMAYAGGQLVLDGDMAARPRRRCVVGEHNFEVVAPDGGGGWFGENGGTDTAFEVSRSWGDWLGQDFSGEVDYCVDVNIPAEWAGSAIELDMGAVAYGATVFVDGERVGSLLWPPWRLRLDGLMPGRHALVIRVANTLANELTSDRVAALWADKSGPGWPSPYHERALAFERESRGGGLEGPVRLRRLKVAETL